MLYGPGTNGGEIVWMLERQSEYAVRVIKRMMRSGATSVEVKRRWADRYHRWLQSKMEGTAWAVSNNYFKSETGKIVTQWPYSPLAYSALTKTLGRWSESTHSDPLVPTPLESRRDVGPSVRFCVSLRHRHQNPRGVMKRFPLRNQPLALRKSLGNRYIPPSKFAENRGPLC